MALLYLNLFQLPAIYKHTLGEVCDTGRNGNGGNAASVKCVRVDAGYRLRELVGSGDATGDTNQFGSISILYDAVQAAIAGVAGGNLNLGQ